MKLIFHLLHSLPFSKENFISAVLPFRHAWQDQWKAVGSCSARLKVAEQRISLELKMSIRAKAQDFEKRLATLKSSQSELDFLVQAFGRGELDHCLDRAASSDFRESLAKVLIKLGERRPSLES